MTKIQTDFIRLKRAPRCSSRYMGDTITDALTLRACNIPYYFDDSEFDKYLKIISKFGLGFQLDGKKYIHCEL